MSTPVFAPWSPATHCTGGPTPGARAWMRWCIENYGHLGGYNLGIYNCRTTRGGSTTSLHGEGRADDVGFPIGDPDGNALVDRVLDVGPVKLGIQAMIYERVIFSAKSPLGRRYTGVAPHWDHIHFEFTRLAGQRLTYATIKKLMDQPLYGPGDRDLSVGDRGNDVAWVQRLLASRYPRQQIATDGIFGPATKRAVLRFELAARTDFPRIQADGVVGDITWKALRKAAEEAA